MSAPTATNWQNQILAEVGAILEDGPNHDPQTNQLSQALERLLPTLWAMNSDWALIPNAPRLQYLHTKRQAIEVLMGQLRTKINGSMGGVSQSLNQKFTNLKMLWDMVGLQIDAILKRARASRGMALAQLLRRAPIQAGPYVAPVPAGQPVNPGPGSYYSDPNDPRYRGYPPGVMVPALGAFHGVVLPDQTGGG